MPWIITFISPCLLPMLPIYISYFAGQNITGNKKVTVTNAIGFVLGFTLVFVSLGAFAGAIGGFLRHHPLI
jgi:cytochrome c-type biogenesis protein